MKQFICRKDYPIVETATGKIRGFQLGSTYIFRGIRYANAKRWEMPESVLSWDGVRDALDYGCVCPVMDNGQPPKGELLSPHRFWPQNEDCLSLNIWTQSLNKDAKKPVMVWLHGGGLETGSSIEHIAYDGENLSVFGDIVVISVNHRLNLLGYFDVSSLGEKYSNSSNAGTADLVCALKWVHENVAVFGGDPDNVTLFGQSGGGVKITTLMQTPSADGLFHKGILSSGVFNDLPPRKDTKTIKQTNAQVVSEMLQYLGNISVEEFAKTPYNRLVEAFRVVNKHRMQLAPVPNDFYLGCPPLVPFTEHANQIPLMVGSVFGEINGFVPPRFERKELDDHTLKEAVVSTYGEEAADEIICEYKKAYPHRLPIDVVSVDAFSRPCIIEYIREKARGTAPVYSFIYAYDVALDGGRVPGHCAEIPYVFHNAELIELCGDTEITEKIEAQLSSSWVNFAYTGNPANPFIPEWPQSTPEKEYCMVFDETTYVGCNHDHKLIELCEKNAPNIFSILAQLKPED